MIRILHSVVLAKYNGDVSQTLEGALELIGGFQALRSPFIIKPNICAGVDKTGFANTNLEVVETLIKLVLEKDRNLSIRIVESDSEAKYADEAFEKFGYKNLEQRLRRLGFDVSLVNLSKLSTVSVKFNGLYFKNPNLPRVLVGHKYFVSIAVAKTHGLTLITGTMKNLFGLLQRKDKSFYHHQINEVIVDLNRLVKPDLCIVDAREGLEGWAGPRTRCINSFILGKKPVSVDATMARIMGFEPERIHHLIEAEKYDLGTLHPNVFGNSPQSIAVKFNLPSHLSPTALVK